MRMMLKTMMITLSKVYFGLLLLVLEATLSIFLCLYVVDGVSCLGIQGLACLCDVRLPAKAQTPSTKSAYKK
eukprot:4606211-Amphidinium_carterae.1